MVKVSVIIPVCNVEKYLQQCLESVTGQTLEDIEIICAEDCSEDGSADILREYVGRDSRIVPIFHDKNLSASQMRKNAVLVSHGEYIMFVDGDDFLMPYACETAYRAIRESGTDILQFGTNIINRTNALENRIEGTQRFVAPCEEYISADRLIREVWGRKKRFGFTLWNKIYKGELCRKAFSFVEDGCFPKANDLYAFFIMAFFAKTYFGIAQPLYNYNFGVGVTGGRYLSGEKFEALLTQKNVYEALERFVRAQGKYGEYYDILEIIKQHLLKECVDKWKDNVRPEQMSYSFDLLAQAWGYEDTLRKLDEIYDERLGINAKLLQTYREKSEMRASLETELIKARQEIERVAEAAKKEVRSTLSYRLGAAVLFIPREIRGGYYISGSMA